MLVLASDLALTPPSLRNFSTSSATIRPLGPVPWIDYRRSIKIFIWCLYKILKWIFTSISMPFSWASFLARGDAATRSPSAELRVVVVVFCSCCLSFFSVEVICWCVLFAESSFFVGSFSFFSVFPDEGLCPSDDFPFVGGCVASSL